jgi:hypothetical protein
MRRPTHRVFRCLQTQLALKASALSYSGSLAGNVMQALEDRTEKSRREMDLHDTIDTVRVLNARNQNIDIDKVIELWLAISIAPFTMFSSPCLHHAVTLRHRLLPHGALTIHWQSLSAAGDSHAATQRVIVFFLFWFSCHISPSPSPSSLLFSHDFTLRIIEISLLKFHKAFSLKQTTTICPRSMTPLTQRVF